MKIIYRFVLIGLSSVLLTPAFSQGIADPGAYYGQQGSENIKKLVEYVRNLGRSLGYDITQKGSPPKEDLLSPPFVQLTQNFAFFTLLGAEPVNAFSSSLSRFFSQEAQAYTRYNDLANYTFQNYSSAAGQQGKISVTPLIDQQKYQSDPVTQAVLNMLTTPDKTYCMNYDASQWTGKDGGCKLLYQGKVAENVIGTLPKPRDFFSYTYNQTFLPQLNSNTLLAPYLYSMPTEEQTGAAGPGRKEEGLSANNQAQVAANFIRYAANIVSPPNLPTQQEYSRLYQQATTADDEITRKNAQASLSNYLTSLRVFAAQSSVALGNLYYMLSKRMPQNTAVANTNNTSQAMSELTMATWRLNNPDRSQNEQWVNKLNQASPATVQKEIAVLLAEINYQLYLSRQQNERLLLTNSILLLQNARTQQPRLNTFQPDQ